MTSIGAARERPDAGCKQHYNSYIVYTPVSEFPVTDVEEIVWERKEDKFIGRYCALEIPLVTYELQPRNARTGHLNAGDVVFVSHYDLDGDAGDAFFAVVSRLGFVSVDANHHAFRMI